MTKQERTTFDGVPYIRLTKAWKMIPLTREQARELLVVEGLWLSTAIRDRQGNSPSTYLEPRAHWWLEEQEFFNLMDKYWPGKKNGDLK